MGCHLKFCSLTAVSPSLVSGFAPKIAHALETKPRTLVLPLHGLECTWCRESLYTEDLTHGQRFGTLRVVDPFRQA